MPSSPLRHHTDRPARRKEPQGDCLRALFWMFQAVKITSSLRSCHTLHLSWHIVLRVPADEPLDLPWWAATVIHIGGLPKGQPAWGRILTQIGDGNGRRRKPTAPRHQECAAPQSQHASPLSCNRHRSLPASVGAPTRRPSFRQSTQGWRRTDTRLRRRCDDSRHRQKYRLFTASTRSSGPAGHRPRPRRSPSAASARPSP